jgi:hypothetical protein
MFEGLQLNIDRSIERRVELIAHSVLDGFSQKHALIINQEMN